MNNDTTHFHMRITKLYQFKVLINVHLDELFIKLHFIQWANFLTILLRIYRRDISKLDCFVFFQVATHVIILII